MAITQEKAAAAKRLYDHLLAHLAENEIKNVESNELNDNNGYHVKFEAVGDDFPMTFHILIETERQLLRLISPQPVTFAKEKLAEVALIIAAINDQLANGSFYLDLTDGSLAWRITIPFVDSLLGDEIFAYMNIISFRTVDEYNDQFIMYNKGLVDANTIIQKVLKDA